MISPAGKKKNKGFLLLEIMVSVGILSIGLVLILSSFMRLIRAIDVSEDYFRAGLLLENKIFEMQYSDTEEGSKDGRFSDFESRFLWHSNVVRLEGDFLDEMNLEVSWNQGNKQKNMSIATYLYRPTL